MASIYCTLCVLMFVFLESTISLAVDSPLKCPDMYEIENGHRFQLPGPPTVLQYSCNIGYHIKGPSQLECVNGTWSPPEPPSCEPDAPQVAMCSSGPPAILNSRVEYSNDDQSFPKPQGSMASIKCDPGYSTEETFEPSYVIRCGFHGLWTMSDGSVHLPACTRKHCPNPPDVPHALYRYDTYDPLISEGLQVEYICASGFSLLDPANARLTCHNGQWDGPVPTCVLKVSCESPSYVRNGKWDIIVKEQNNVPPTYEQRGDAEYPKFEVGTEIEYSCGPGYKLVGHRVLRCQASQMWSSDPPMCIPQSENTWYCPDIGQIKNGYCKCVSERTADLQLCMPFHRGTQIECTCLQGYKLQGMDVLTCSHSSNLNIGVWDWDPPQCHKDFDPDSEMDMVPDNQNQGQSYSTGDISDGKNKVSSLVIVVTTACSVLGVLLLIMVIVVFRRKKPRAHLFQQGPAPPPYARVHNNSLDEHDRMALMAYADASRIHLPTYEEAVRPGAGIGGGAALPGGPGAGRSSSPTSSEYRRLPNVHPAVRAANLQHQQNIGGDGNNNINNNNNNNSNRHSTVTTSTMNRDGVSEIFGSLDTVNVSMSDASTSVTVETFDSGTSNRSMASQRATAGSLSSADDQLANDDAPLLDSNSQRDVDVASVSSNPSRTSKEEQ